MFFRGFYGFLGLYVFYGFSRVLSVFRGFVFLDVHPDTFSQLVFARSAQRGVR